MQYKAKFTEALDALRARQTSTDTARTTVTNLCIVALHVASEQ